MNNKTNETNETRTEFKPKRPANKKDFDMEYATQYRKEYEYLHMLNIDPCYVKCDTESGVRTYKYKKTAELFTALGSFYSLYPRTEAK